MMTTTKKIMTMTKKICLKRLWPTQFGMKTCRPICVFRSKQALSEQHSSNDEDLWAVKVLSCGNAGEVQSREDEGEGGTKVAEKIRLLA